MKILLTIIVVSMLLAGVLIAAGANNAVDLSTLGKNNLGTITIPVISQGLASIPATHLGENTTPGVSDLSTLNKPTVESTTSALKITGPSPVTITPMFSIKNQNISTQANTVFTLPLAISSNSTVYTPPIAIFGGA